MWLSLIYLVNEISNIDINTQDFFQKSPETSLLY